MKLSENMIKTAQNEMLPCMHTLWGILKRCICVLPVKYVSLIRYGRFENSLKRKSMNGKKHQTEIEREHDEKLHKMR